MFDLQLLSQCQCRSTVIGLESKFDLQLLSQRGSISRVPDRNGVSLLCIMLEIHHS